MSHQDGVSKQQIFTSEDGRVALHCYKITHRMTTVGLFKTDRRWAWKCMVKLIIWLNCLFSLIFSLSVSRRRSVRE